MFEQLKQRLLSFRLDKRAVLPLVGGAAVLITTLIVISLWQSNQGYTALFGSQEQIPVSQVVEALNGESILYRIHPSDGQILVREDDLAKARMALAAKGINVIKPEGYELMDKEEMLGTSQFIQNVRYKRSLEGELAKSVMTLDQVDSARVHLGVTEASSFVLNNRNESSASVVIRLKHGQQLKEDQVAAIIQLVAGSVPGMKAEKVRVVDQQGQLLSDGVQASGGSNYSAKNGSELAKRLQTETERSIANLLGSVVGENNYRISVATQLDLSNVEETQERYNGEPRVSNENVNQENTTDALALGIPGSLSNRAPNTPPADTANANNGANTQQAMSTRNQAQRQYAYDRDIRHIRHPGYRVEKMSVAIVLNQNAPLIKDWKPEQLTQLNKLISDAAGINTARGDSLTLSQMAFTPPVTFEETPIKWWEDPVIIRWIERGGIGLLALLLLIFGINPLLRRLGRKNDPVTSEEQKKLASEGDTEESDESQDEQNANSGLPRNAFQSEENLPPQSSGLETKIEHLQLLAQSETERVAEVIKQWINSNERSGTKQDQ